ncbi:MAG: hypothetical protein IMZ53_01420 [Thermoplasmata archaeon]|nr:hypothetical protein [Thermoplasmata archaeon]MBE3139222.1 hypothetical protein [Thermoplasmata archaeon]
MTLKDLIELEKYTQEHKVVPGVIMTKTQAKIYTRIDKILGIHHKWSVGDKYYTLLCHLTPEEVE